MLLIYRCLINFLYPFFVLIIFLRIFFNKESKQRYKEKLFASSFNIEKNADKKLIWFHVASIGEFKSIIPIIKKLDENNIYQFLITSVTLSSSQLISKELLNKKNIFHRFFPIDTVSLVKKFLDGWSPNLIVFVDSEIWPNFLSEIKRRKIPSILINGRITKKTFERWALIPGFAKNIFDTFDLCLASSNESEKYLKKLNAKNVKFIGNLKFTNSINLESIDDDNRLFFNQKKFWCAASTHKGEEIFCIKTHIILKTKYKKIITIIIPRHINRSHEIQFLCKKYSLKSQILNSKEIIKDDKEVIIINSFGMLPKYFKYAKSVFSGKSILSNLKPVGGQNPIEAAKLGCKIYHGPYVSNFKEIYKLLKDYGISEVINNEKELSEKLIIDLQNTKPNENSITTIINNLGKKILEQSMNEISKIKIL